MKFNKHHFTLSKKIIMGICNITPDSFSDGGLSWSKKQAKNNIDKMINDGASIIDIGAESSRPGSKRINLIEEKKRLEKIIPLIDFSKSLYSIDSYKIEIQDYCLKKGFHIVNNINGGSEELFQLIKKYNAGAVIMHKIGDPETMQKKLNHNLDILKSFKEFISMNKKLIKKFNINFKKIWFDPGIGFGKSLSQNLILMKNLKKFQTKDVQIMLGASRKSWINGIHQSNSNQRLGGSLAAISSSLIQNVNAFRVHDVQETFQFIKIYESLNS